MRIVATRHGQARFNSMTAQRPSRAAHTNGNRGFANRVPHWYVGSVAEFMAALQLMDEGKMPRPTLAEMAKYDSLILSADVDKEEEAEEDEPVSVS